jgi:hypothetical protein
MYSTNFLETAASTMSALNLRCSSLAAGTQNSSKDETAEDRMKSQTNEQSNIIVSMNNGAESPPK